MGPVFYNSNRSNPAAACEHCKQVARHESWCITQSATVFYAYDAVVNPSKLTMQDELILHSLGVSWKSIQLGGECAL